MKRKRRVAEEYVIEVRGAENNRAVPDVIVKIAIDGNLQEIKKKAEREADREGGGMARTQTAREGRRSSARQARHRQGIKGLS